MLFKFHLLSCISSFQHLFRKSFFIDLLFDHCLLSAVPRSNILWCGVLCHVDQTVMSNCNWTFGKMLVHPWRFFCIIIKRGKDERKVLELIQLEGNLKRTRLHKNKQEEQIGTIVSSMELTKYHARSQRIRRIQCENGLFLEVLCDGSLQGVQHKITDYGKQIRFSIFLLLLDIISMTAYPPFIDIQPHLICPIQYCPICCKISSFQNLLQVIQFPIVFCFF